VGAAAVGIVAAIVMTVVGLATCDARCVSAAGSNYTFGVVGELIFGFIWSPVFAVVLGTLPGLVALTMTPAAITRGALCPFSSQPPPSALRFG